MKGTGNNRVQVVWFKRDLRVRDHAPLSGAAASGPMRSMRACSVRRFSVLKGNSAKAAMRRRRAA